MFGKYLMWILKRKKELDIPHKNHCVSYSASSELLAMKVTWCLTPFVDAPPPVLRLRQKTANGPGLIYRQRQLSLCSKECTTNSTCSSKVQSALTFPPARTWASSRVTIVWKIESCSMVSRKVTVEVVPHISSSATWKSIISSPPRKVELTILAIFNYYVETVIA